MPTWSRLWYSCTELLFPDAMVAITKFPPQLLKILVRSWLFEMHVGAEARKCSTLLRSLWALSGPMDSCQVQGGETVSFFGVDSTRDSQVSQYSVSLIDLLSFFSLGKGRKESRLVSLVGMVLGIGLSLVLESWFGSLGLGKMLQ